MQLVLGSYKSRKAQLNRHVNAGPCFKRLDVTALGSLAGKHIHDMLLVM